MASNGCVDLGFAGLRRNRWVWWLVCRGLRQREDEREKQGLCHGWCCGWRPMLGCAVVGAMGCAVVGAMGCAGGGGHWLCGFMLACVVRIKKNKN